MNFRKFFLVYLALTFASSLCFAMQRVEERDRDGDGRKETKIYFEDEKIIKMEIDENGDGKVDAVVYFKNGVPDTGQRDSDYNGKIDTWIKYDATGAPIVIGSDRHGRGKPDYWIYLKNGRIYMREWDRNFDGMPDFRTLEEDHRLIEKLYDDNFDGKFERTVKAPAKGETGKTRTTAGP